MGHSCLFEEEESEQDVTEQERGQYVTRNGTYLSGKLGNEHGTIQPEPDSLRTATHSLRVICTPCDVSMVLYRIGPVISRLV